MSNCSVRIICLLLLVLLPTGCTKIRELDPEGGPVGTIVNLQIENVLGSTDPTVYFDGTVVKSPVVTRNGGNALVVFSVPQAAQGAKIIRVLDPSDPAEPWYAGLRDREDEASFVVMIASEPTPEIISGCPPSPVTVGKKIVHTCAAAGGMPPYTWSGGPPGSTWSGSMMSWTPASTGDVSFVVSVEDSKKMTATKKCDIRVDPPPEITILTTRDWAVLTGMQGMPGDNQVRLWAQSDGGIASNVNWSIQQPAGLAGVLTQDGTDPKYWWYTAPTTFPRQGDAAVSTIEIKAVSKANPSVGATTTICLVGEDLRNLVLSGHYTATSDKDYRGKATLRYRPAYGQVFCWAQYMHRELGSNLRVVNSLKIVSAGNLQTSLAEIDLSGAPCDIAFAEADAGIGRDISLAFCVGGGGPMKLHAVELRSVSSGTIDPLLLSTFTLPAVYSPQHIALLETATAKAAVIVTSEQVPGQTGSHYVLVMDTRDPKNLAVMPEVSAVEPTGVAIDEAGNVAFVACGGRADGSERLVAIKIETDTVSGHLAVSVPRRFALPTVGAPGEPTGIAAFSDADQLVIAGTGGIAVWRLSDVRNAVGSDDPIAPVLTYQTPDAGPLVGRSGGILFSVDLDSQAQMGRVRILRHPDWTKPVTVNLALESHCSMSSQSADIDEETCRLFVCHGQKRVASTGSAGEEDYSFRLFARRVLLPCCNPSWPSF